MLNAIFHRQAKKDVSPQAAQTPPERPELPYNPALVTALTVQHRSLLALLTKAQRAAQQQQFGDIPRALELFRNGLNEHLKRESIELHPYLAAHLKGEGGKDLLREIRANSLYLERGVAVFLDHYARYPVADRTALRFGIEISGVMEDFTERTAREEADIYTLYMPPEAY